MTHEDWTVGLMRGRKLSSAIAVWMLWAICGVACPVALAQSSTGGIYGRVEDPQQATISGATVLVTSLSTDTNIHVTSNAAGEYSLTSLPAGTYRVTISKKGFGTVVVDSVIVNIAQNARADVKLPIATLASEVVVQADSQLLNTSNATMTAQIPTQVAEDMPYPDNAAMEAVTLAPGVQGDPQYNQGIQSQDPPIYTQPTTPGGSLAIGGGRPGSTEQLVDGFDVTMIGYPRAGILFSGANINQITIQVNGIEAQYGRTGGGIINQSTKSGGDRYHGLIAYRHYDPFLEATTYAVPSGQDARQNLFTGTFGGPIPLPKIRKNTFFFVSFEPLRYSSTVESQIRVPTIAELQGNFENSETILNTSILQSQGYAAAIAAPRVGGIYSHFSMNAQGFPMGVPFSSSSQYVPYANNSVAAQLAANPAAQYVLSLFPTASTKYLHFLYADQHLANNGDNALGARGIVDSDNRYNIRTDHNFNNGDHVFGRYTSTPVSGVRFAFLGPDSPLNNYPNSVIDTKNAVADYTHIFGKDRVNDLRYSYLRMNYQISPAPSTINQNYAAKLNFFPSELGAGFPTLNLDTGGYGSSTGGNDGGISLNEEYAVGDDFSMQVGRHNLTMGGEWRAMQLNRTPNSGLYGGSYSFQSTNNGSSGGNNTASFILGEISSFTVAAPQTFHYRFKYAAFYAQDAWRATSKLTVNAGIRYNLEPPRTETNNLQGSLISGLSGTLNGVPAVGGFAFSGQNGLPKTLWPTNYAGFEPRLGVAYAMTPATVISASYSLLHAPLTGVTNSNIPSLSPASLSIGGSLGGTNPAAYVSYITNPIAPFTVPGVIRSGPVFSLTGTVIDVPQTNIVPYVQSWSVSVQRQIGKHAVASAAYAGQVGRHLFSTPENVNLVPLSTMISEIQAGANFNNMNTVNQYGPSIGTGNLNENLVPYPQFDNATLNAEFLRTASSSYNALYLTGKDELAFGVTVIASFTWSKSLDNASTGSLDTIGTAAFSGGDYGQQQSPFCPNQCERSYSTFDMPVHTNVGYVWNIPVGRGKQFAVNGALLNNLVGGWEVSGIFSATSGYPMWVLLNSAGYFISTAPGGAIGGNGSPISGTNGESGGFGIRPNIVPGVPLIVKNWRQDPFGLTGPGYLNPAAFTTPGSLGNPAFGDAPRNLGDARNPHIVYYDMSVAKRFGVPLRAGREGELKLKIDAINAFNHTNFFIGARQTLDNGLNSSTGIYNLSPSFGDIGQGNNTPGRTVALGAAITF